MRNTEMRSFEELKAFIELKALEYRAVDEGVTNENFWQCELIEIEIIRAIALFAASEGMTKLDGANFPLYIEYLQNTKGESDFENAEAWEDWCDNLDNLSEVEYEVSNALNVLAEAKQLPEKTQYLYDLWQHGFYPDFYPETPLTPGCVG